MLYALPAGAVHSTGAFELDGNAVHNTTDDWDNVCHQVTITNDTTNSITNECATAANTNGATAVAWSAEPNLNSTIFTGGGSKDPINVDQWAWKDGAGGLPDKDNLLHSFAARYSLAPNAATCPSGGKATCDVLFFGSDRYDNSGDAQQGFWFFQNAIGLGTAPSGGGFKFTGVHKNGDLLVISDFSNGGTTSTITIYKWNSAVSGNLELLETSDNAKCAPALADTDAFCGIVNPSNGTTAPWTFTDKSGLHTYLNGEFYEGGINLSLLGLSDECFSSVASETRSSTSTTATLKDFVLGTFGNCNASMSTSVNAGPYTPGTSLHDTATVVGSSASHTPSGDVTFYLCAVATGACTSGGTPLGTGALSGTGATATASSPNVNTAGSPLSPGRYCFRAEWPGDANYTTAIVEYGGVNGTNECFTVSKIDTTTVTTPVNASGTPVTSVSLGTTVNDSALVTGNAAGGDPTGQVNFYVCSNLASPGTCDGTINVGAEVAGNPKTLTPDTNAATYTATAKSGDFTPGSVGRYCFRAEYGGNTVYNASSDSSATECFVVTDSTSASSAQNWLPNDSATITSANGSPLSGTLTITLYPGGTCTGTPVPNQGYSFDLSGAASPVNRATSNTSYKVSESTTVSWKVAFTSSNANIAGSEHCESTALTITN